MFPLSSKIFPPNAEALREALEESLRQAVTPAGSMVVVEDKSYPALAAIRVSLDGARARDSVLPRPSAAEGPVEPGLTVECFEINGQSITVQQAVVNLSCTARDVRLDQGRDRNGNVLLLLQDATEGKMELVIALADLEALLLAGAKATAGRQGVSVEDVRIDLRPRTARAMDVLVQVRAKKLFVSATVRISGLAEIDERLNARLSELKCAGDGTLGSLACGFVTPQLQRFDGREFSLMALPFGGVKLRDVQIATGKELRVTAEFGRVA